MSALFKDAAAEKPASQDTPQIIPLADLYLHLVDPRLEALQPPQELVAEISYNAAVYGSWFPEETRHQFDLAHQLLEREGRKASFALMELEQLFAPDAGRFVSWLVPLMNDWNKKMEGQTELSQDAFRELSLAVNLSSSWQGVLPPDDLKKINAVFAETYRLVNREGFSWYEALGTGNLLAGMMGKMLFLVRIAHLAGSEMATPRLVLDEKFFAQSPEQVLDSLKTAGFSFYQNLNYEEATKAWGFFVRAHSQLNGRGDYWHRLGYFLQVNPEFVPRFFALKRQGYWQIPSDDRVHLFGLYVGLIQWDVVPEEYRREAYLFVLGQKGGDLSPYQALPDLPSLERRIIADTLVHRVNDPDLSYQYFDEMGWHLFKRYAQGLGAEKTAAMLREVLPPELSQKMGPSFRVLRLLVDHSADESVRFLQEYQNPNLREYKAAVADPLWRDIWGLFDSSHSLSAPTQDQYDLMLRKVPGYLVQWGKVDLVRQFYLANHPYAPVYQLPSGLRPTGAGQVFASIDSFPDLTRVRHPDKADLKVLPLDRPRWLKEDNFSHGIGVSTFAVGRTMGLAPMAKLYAASILDNDFVNLPQAVLDGLRHIRDLKKQGKGDDRKISVVGMSLGLEVPHEFRDVIRSSPLYQEMERVCQELYEMQVAVVAAAGNDGHQENINMLGFLPHVQLVGAMDSNLTREREDDLESSYTTGGDQMNPVRFWAHADPVLFSGGRDQITWSRVGGGTSTAQPHFSATLILLREVNPSLSLDDYYRILEKTADDSLNNHPVRSIDPMEALVAAAHLPGSRYQGDRLVEFSRQLGYDSYVYRQSENFASLRQAMSVH